MTVLIAGSANLDYVVRARRVPAAGETVMGRDLTTFPGGKGANQAVAAARAGGVATLMLLALGEDAAAELIKTSLRDAGVVLKVQHTPGLATGSAFVCLGDDAENAITVVPGANAALLPEHLPSLSGVSHLLLQLETPLTSVIAYAQAARSAGVSVALNAAPAQALPDALLAALDVLVVNEGELSAIVGPAASLAGALAQLSVPTVVVTLGARGCLARSAGRHLLQAAFAIKAVDSTAAGDTFCGVLIAALSQGHELAIALKRASAAAALACTRLGAQTSVPTQAELDAFLDTHQALPDDELASYCGLRSEMLSTIAA